MKASLIELIHRALTIQRWNDHIRPFTGFSEIDKQSHKIYYAYILGKCEEEEGGTVDWRRLAEGLIFEFLHRIVLTDIKPPVYYKLRSQKENEINQWVANELYPMTCDIEDGFFEHLKQYYFEPLYAKTEKKIISFSHYLATKWEFDIIYPMNINMYHIERTKSEVNASLENCGWFSGRKFFHQTPDLSNFLNFIGQLRFQQRWTATARMPQTSVMGHTLVVAMLSYFLSVSLGACDKRIVNNFFGGIFHDLPEVLTRDIISPVKNGVEGLEGILKEIEDQQMREIIYPLFPKKWLPQLKHYTENEFSSKIISNNGVTILTSDEISASYNEDCFSPIDGQLIRACDHYSAYFEAYMSIQNGIQSEALKKAIVNLSEKYKDLNISGIELKKLFDYFKI